MTAVTEVEPEVDLHRKYTAEEREALYNEYFDSCGGNREEAIRRLRGVPIPPRWAKFIAELMGKEYLRENFNITHADEVFGEGWLDEED